MEFVQREQRISWLDPLDTYTKPKRIIRKPFNEAKDQFRIQLVLSRTHDSPPPPSR